MLTLPGWLVILIEQGLIVLLVLVVVLYLRARRLKRLLVKARAESGDGEHVQAPRTEIELMEHGMLQERLALSQQQVKNLERFRDMFFDLNNKVRGLLESQHQVHGQMQAVGLPLKEQQALLKAYEKLSREKEQLEQHLKQVDAELAVLLDDSKQGRAAEADAGDADIIQEQQAEISRLIQEIADLTLETAAASRIHSNIVQLNQKTKELTIAIEVLQDENQFLANQIQVLLQQQNEKDRQLLHEIDELTKQLAGK